MDAYLEVKKEKLKHKIFTDDPVLAYSLKDKGVSNIDDLIDYDENFMLGEISLSVADKIDKITINNKIKDINFIEGLTIARPLGVFISSLFYRALLFSRFVNKYQIKEVMIFVNEEWNISSGYFMEISRFSNIFSKLCNINFFDNKIKFKVFTYKLDKKSERVDSSINNIFIKALLFPFNVNIRELLYKTGILSIIPFKKKIIVIGEPDGIIRESLPALNILGYKEIILPKVLKGIKYEFDKIKKNKLTIQNYNIEFINVKKHILETSFLSGIFSSNELNKLVVIINEVLNYHISMLPKWVKATDNYTEKIINTELSDNKIILATALSNPLSKVFHNILNYNKYSIILFEHGVTKGLSALSANRLHISEIYNSDYFVGYSKGSLSILNNLLEDRKIKGSITAAPLHTKKVYFKSLQRLIWRKILNIKNKDIAVIHVSPLPYSGNRRLGYGAPTETQVFNIEKNFIEIYNQINKNIYFKKYPANRFPYKFKYKEIFPEYKKVKFIGDIDYRYLRSAFDIIVTGNPTSTFSWCLSANKPLIFFDSKKISPLINNTIRKKIEKSVFYINLDLLSWQESLKNILNMPYNDLIKIWQEKSLERKKFIEEHIFCNTKHPGTKVANFVNSLIIKNE